MAQDNIPQRIYRHTWCSRVMCSSFLSLFLQNILYTPRSALSHNYSSMFCQVGRKCSELESHMQQKCRKGRTVAIPRDSRDILNIYTASLLLHSSGFAQACTESLRRLHQPVRVTRYLFRVNWTK